MLISTIDWLRDVDSSTDGIDRPMKRHVIGKPFCQPVILSTRTCFEFEMNHGQTGRLQWINCSRNESQVFSCSWSLVVIRLEHLIYMIGTTLKDVFHTVSRQADRFVAGGLESRSSNSPPTVGFLNWQISVGRGPLPDHDVRCYFTNKKIVKDE